MARVPYVDIEALPDEYEILKDCRQFLHESVDADYWNSAKTVQAFGNNRKLARAHVNANVSVWAYSGLTPREVEIVILAVARELKSTFEWHAHSIIAVERAGVAPETILAIARQELVDVDERTRTLIEYVFEFVREGGATGDRMHEQLAAFYGDDTIVGITMLAGFYIHIDHVAHALEIDNDEEFVGWELENLPTNHERFG